MKTTSTRQDQGIPGVYGLLLLDVVSRWGYNDETLFAPFHLTSEQLADPNYRIPTPVANELVKHALRLTGESTLGFHLGTQMRSPVDSFNCVYHFYNYTSRPLGQKQLYNCNVILKLSLYAPKSS